MFGSSPFKSLSLRQHALDVLLTGLLLFVVAFLAFGPLPVVRVAPMFLIFFACLVLAWRSMRLRRFVRAVFWLALALCWLVYFHDVNKWLQGLGSDSFAETTAPTSEELLFWLKTMSEVIQPSVGLHTAAFILLAAIALIVLFEGLARFSRAPVTRVSSRYSAFGFAVLAIAFMSFSARSVIAYVDNSSLFDRIMQNFAAPSDLVAETQRPLDIAVYIGESTTSLHWSLYGYPRKTTPELEKIKGEDAGLLVFDNVYSTHTHTTQSLLEALSIAASDREDAEPITDRHRIPISDILQAAGVETVYYSNQGRGGTFNLMAPVIFARTPQFYSADTRLAGNLEPNVSRPLDDAYFTNKLMPNTSGTPRVTFLHSNAGHGPYLARVSKDFQHKVDSLPEDIGEGAMMGRGAAPLADIEAYDSTMAYVDHAVASRVRDVASLTRPTVLIYFSDHGEAPSDLRGHESSRFLYEMLRVPFLVYFNPAARAAYPDLFDQYAASAGSDTISSLAQVPATIIDLLDVSFTVKGRVVAKELPAVGVPAHLPLILVRKLGDGVAATNLQSLEQPVRFSGDDILRAGIAARQLSPMLLCYPEANSVVAARRGIMTTGCLGLDLTLKKETAELAVDGRPQPALNIILGMAAKHSASAWLTLHDISKPGCEALSRQVSVAGNIRRVIAAFDPSASEAVACAEALHKVGIEAVATVNTKDGDKLSAAIQNALSGGFEAVSVDAAQWQDGALTGIKTYVRNVRPQDDMRSYAAAAGVMLALEDPNSR